MTAGTITNETLYELIKELKTDTNRQFAEMKVQFTELKTDTNRQFSEMKVQFTELKTDTNRQFGEARELLRDEKREREKMEEKMEQVYESRNRVTVSFSRAFAFTNGGISAVIALLVALFASHK